MKANLNKNKIPTNEEKKLEKFRTKSLDKKLSLYKSKYKFNEKRNSFNQKKVFQ